jgi:hypothetical protein
MLGQEPATDLASNDAVWLFQIPEHLRETWWMLLDATAESGVPMQGFDEFADKVSAFLTFKRLTVSGSLQMEVIVTAAGSARFAATPKQDEDPGWAQQSPRGQRGLSVKEWLYRVYALS